MRERGKRGLKSCRRSKKRGIGIKSDGEYLDKVSGLLSLFGFILLEKPEYRVDGRGEEPKYLKKGSTNSGMGNPPPCPKENMLLKNMSSPRLYRMRQRQMHQINL